MVRHGQGECNKEVMCTTAEQDSVRLGTDTKTLRGSKFVLMTQCAASKRAFPKRRLDRNENTNPETEPRVISKRMGNRFCNARPCRARGLDPRWHILRTSALFQGLRSTVNRLSNSSRFPPQQYQTDRGRHEYEHCDVCVNRSDDNVLDDCFQVSQRLTCDPTTTPQLCHREIDNAANRADQRSARHVRSWLQEWKIPSLERKKEKDTQYSNDTKDTRDSAGSRRIHTVTRKNVCSRQNCQPRVKFDTPKPDARTTFNKDGEKYGQREILESRDIRQVPNKRRVEVQSQIRDSLIRDVCTCLAHLDATSHDNYGNPPSYRPTVGSVSIDPRLKFGSRRHSDFVR